MHRNILPSINIKYHGIELISGSSSNVLAFASTVEQPDFLRAAVAKRRYEFLAGRYCLREALRSLSGTLTGDLLARDGDGRPILPDGVVGSITHSDVFAAAAVASAAEVEAIGIDSEQIVAPDVALEVGALVATVDELERLVAVGLAYEAALSLAFSAKESLFKCLNPIVRRFFDYRDAELIAADLGAGAFTIRLMVDLDARFRRGACFEGGVGFRDDHVNTAIALMR